MSLEYMRMACPRFRWLLMHSACFAFWRALLKAGMSIATKMAMMPMTTNSSTNVKNFPFFMALPLPQTINRNGSAIVYC